MGGGGTSLRRTRAVGGGARGRGAAVAASQEGPAGWSWFIADRLTPYFTKRDRLGPWRLAGEAGLSAARRVGQEHALAAMECSLGLQLTGTGGRDLIRRAAARYRRVGDLEGEARSANSLGLMESTLSTGLVALEYFRRAHELAVRTPNRRLQAATELHTAGMLRQIGRLDEAMVAMGRAQRLYAGEQQAGDHSRQSLGQLLQERGDLTVARSLLEEEVAGLRDGDLKLDLAEALERLATIHRDAGDFGAAARIAEEAVALSLSTGDRLVACHAQATLGDALLGLGHRRPADEHYRAALSGARTTAAPDVEVRALAGRAAVQLADGEPEPAWEQARSAADLAARLERPVLHGGVLETVALAAQAAGRPSDAESAAAEAVTIHRRCNARVYLTSAERTLTAVRRARPY